MEANKRKRMTKPRPRYDHKEINIQKRKKSKPKTYEEWLISKSLTEIQNKQTNATYSD